MNLPLAKLSPWTRFSYCMIAAAPTLGSLTTAAGAVASLIAAAYLFRNWRLYPLSPGTKYLVFVLAFYSSSLLLAGSRAGIDLALLKSIPVYSQFIYFIPLAIVLPHKGQDMTLLGVSRAAMAGVAIATAGAAVESIYTNHTNVELLAGNALIFAAILVVLSFLCLAQFKQKSVGERWLSAGLALSSLFTVAMLARTNGPALSFIVFFFLALCLTALSLEWWRTSIISGLLAVIMVVLATALWFAAMQSPAYQIEHVSEPMRGKMIEGAAVSAFGTSILSTFYDTGGVSFYMRGVMYRAGIDAFIQQPILGYGPQNRFSAAMPYMQQELEVARLRTKDKQFKQQLQRYKSLRFSHLHNMFINHAVAAGMLGVIAVLLILTSPLVLLAWTRDWLQRLQYMYVAATFSLLVIFMGMTNLIFFHDLHNSFTLFNLIVFCVLINRAMQSHQAAKAPT